MEELDAREIELKAKFAQWSDEMTKLENELDVLYDRGEPLSSPEMVRISKELTSLRLKLMRLDQEYEDYLLEFV